jgi:hypothetical protein
MGKHHTRDSTGNYAPAVQISIANAILVIGAASALNLLLGKPVALAEDEAAFGDPQSRQDPLQTHLERSKEAGQGRRATLPI